MRFKSLILSAFILASIQSFSVEVENISAPTEAVLALTTQKVDAVVIDNEPAKNFVAKNTGLKVVDTGAVKEDYAIAIAKGNKELLDKVNTGLKTLKENGKYDELIAKWFK